jgi:hypothetical protein
MMDILVDDSILNQMKTRGIKGVKYFTNEKHRLNKYYKEWNLYCYNLDKLIKGDEDEKL